MGDTVGFGGAGGNASGGHVGLYLGHNLYISATEYSHVGQKDYFGQQNLVIKLLGPGPVTFRRPDVAP
jgi:cell wall-associated NlpC family hydrolase